MDSPPEAGDTRGSAPADDGPRRLQGTLRTDPTRQPGQADPGGAAAAPAPFLLLLLFLPALLRQAPPLPRHQRCRRRRCPPGPRLSVAPLQPPALAAAPAAAPPAVVVARRELPPPRPGEAEPGAAATASLPGCYPRRARPRPAPAGTGRGCQRGGRLVGTLPTLPAGLWPWRRAERLTGQER